MDAMITAADMGLIASDDQTDLEPPIAPEVTKPDGPAGEVRGDDAVHATVAEAALPEDLPSRINPAVGDPAAGSSARPVRKTRKKNLAEAVPMILAAAQMTVVEPMASSADREVLEGLATRIHSELDGLADLFATALDRKLELGRLLSEAKDRCKSGGVKWLEFLSPFSISERNAGEAIQFFRNLPEIEDMKRHGGADLTVSAVRKALSRGKAKTERVEQFDSPLVVRGDEPDSTSSIPAIPLLVAEEPTIHEVTIGIMPLHGCDGKVAIATAPSCRHDEVAAAEESSLCEVPGQTCRDSSLFELCGRVADGLDDARVDLEAGHNETWDLDMLSRVSLRLFSVLERLKATLPHPGEDGFEGEGEMEDEEGD